MARPALSLPLAGGSSRERWLRALLLALLAAALVSARAPRQRPGDFCTYYAAGRLVLDGHAAAAYDRGALGAAHAAAHGETPHRIGGFLYSPLLLLPAAAVATLPFPAAQAAHRFAGTLLLALGLALVLRRVGAPALELALASAFCLSHTAWTQLIYQNWGIGLFVAVAAAFAAARGGRTLAAGAAWALAGHLKAFLALVAAPLLATRWRRQLAVAALAALLLALLSLPWVGLGAWSAWAASLGGLSARGVTPYYNKVSLAAGLARFAVDPRAWLAPLEPAAVALTRVLLGAGAALLLLAAARLRRDPERLAAAALAAVLLCVPQVWDHTEVLLFAALPALPRRAIWALAGALALSAGYGPLVGAGLERVLRGGLPAAPVAGLLLFYPFLNLALLGTALAAGPRPAEAPDA